MCGIVGYIGKREASPIILEGLSRMEYRGYDSAGFVVIENDSAELYKTKGRVADLTALVGSNKVSGHLGIGHTRWATHGEPNQTNAHPHTDCTGKFFVVHNGIIENYAPLKAQLQKEGHEFKSDTDTEVLVHLIEKYYKADLAQAVKKVLKEVVGSYGIAVVSSLEPETLVAARFGSPLILGIGAGEELIVASDLTAILPLTQKVVYLEDGEMVVCTGGNYTITDFHNKQQDKVVEQVDWSLEAAERGGYPHFMLKEIFEQPEAIINSIRGRLIPSEGLVKLGGLEQIQKKLQSIDRVVIVGMGTARHAGLVGEYLLEEYGGLPVEVEFASEFAYRKPVLSPNTAVLAISQSGETADTLLAIEEAKRKGALVLGLVNVTGSSIARTTDAGVYNHIGPEIAVASTKAFVSQIAVLTLLSVYFGRMRTMSLVTGQHIIKEMGRIPKLMKEILSQSDAIAAIAEKYKASDNMFYLGRKYNFPVALEGALKVKEVAYVYAEGYNGGEMKHGPIALIEKDFPVVIIVPDDSVYEKNISHIQELKVRGARILAIATEGNQEVAGLVDDVIYIPKTLEMLTPLLATIPLQLFAYYIAVARGCDVDKPRNLAKSVTVE